MSVMLYQFSTPVISLALSLSVVKLNFELAHVENEAELMTDI